MLIVYLESFTAPQQQLLRTWGQRVHCWPRSYTEHQRYMGAVASDWWMLFHDPVYADIWLIKYSHHSHIVRTLFD